MAFFVNGEFTCPTPWRLCPRYALNVSGARVGRDFGIILPKKSVFRLIVRKLPFQSDCVKYGTRAFFEINSGVMPAPIALAGGLKPPKKSKISKDWEKCLFLRILPIIPTAP